MPYPTYWAVKPTNQDCIRIERAHTPIQACDQAFGRSSLKAKYNVGHWLVKNLGTRVSVIQSDRKRKALLSDPSGWFDPYAST